MELPKGMNLSVPDLSALRPKEPLVAITVKPGDRVIVLLPRQASKMEIERVGTYLRQWAPETVFLILAGPESVTVIPRAEKIQHPSGDDGGDGHAWDPSEDREPQGLNDDGGC